ncbi:zinc finger protein NUTCRACKER-like [Tripterygium wilfordii]|uniref:Zinc finger protein NUTCRACKER-like n=1 Tax=Tripterygium wilfordii TaxID=458696 RepID=A0A7J7DCY2_TRIWF|nr:zinc finger protein GAI-ASSOCIATED FACTOR 1-like [Tripterygium wilfordii]KAF5744154.1 zinc finger protein NUTCRACKER-like [Tripterygium wilfordii]
MSNITGDDDGGSFSSGNTGEEEVLQIQDKEQTNHLHGSATTASSTASNGNNSTSQQQPIKKKRNLPGTPDPNAEVIALSPTTLMATNRFVCEICHKGFQRDQNLQLHRRGHNLPWKLKQSTSTKVRKRVYICPEPTCVHHNPARALGDLTGIKKHFSRKHGEKKWKCDKCAKKYAVQSDWKAHQKTCGTREYKCDCGTIFSRRDSFITHRAFCDALAEENSKINQGLMATMGSEHLQSQRPPELISSFPLNSNPEFNNFDLKNPLKSIPQELVPVPFKPMNMSEGMFSSSSGSLFGAQRSISSSSSNLQLSSNNSSGLTYLHDAGSAHMSATALLQKAAQMGASTASNSINSPMMQKSFTSSMAGPDQISSSIRPQQQISYNVLRANQQINNNSIDHHPHQQSNMDGIQGATGGFANQMSHLFDGGSAMNDMGMFTGMFMSSSTSHDQQINHQAFLKNIEQQHSDSNSTSGLMQGRDEVERNLTVPSRFNGSSRGGNDMMTVDFLGIGGGSRPANLPDHHHHQQQQLEAMSQHRLQPMMNHLQQQLSHGAESAMQKNVWDV